MLERAKERITQFTDRETATQFLRFALVGAFNTVLDFSVYVFLTRTFASWGAHPVRAAVASFCVGVVSSFLLNTFWTFRAGDAKWHTRIVKFALVAVSGLTLNASIMYALISVGTYDLLAKALATATVLVWNFTMQRRWTFRVVELVPEEAEREE